MKTAFFRFEASLHIGAGHAIRCCVIADALLALGWKCSIVTSSQTYEFISDLIRFDRVEPEKFYSNPLDCDLLVVDQYDLDQEYEKHFRPFVTTIVVIDDLANRKHDCDILVDQIYGRDPSQYEGLVPDNCKILTGSDYVLLRNEFIKLRPKALEKRRNTKEIKRILVSMGGGSSKSYILKALELIKAASFKGTIDVVLGFSSQDYQAVKAYLDTLTNQSSIHINANMPELAYEADLAIGTAGCSIWERGCLGLPQFIIKPANTQKESTKFFVDTDFGDFLKNVQSQGDQNCLLPKIDGLGIIRVLSHIEDNFDKLKRPISHQKMHESDMNLVYSWQQNKKLREFSLTKETPTYEEHQKWFLNKVNDPNTIFEKVMCGDEPCGALRLDYSPVEDSWTSNRYVISEFQNNGIGTIILKFAKMLCVGAKLKSFTLKDNISSHKSAKKGGGTILLQNEKGTWYVY